jgi:Concanavalin A-like lectin/glucanases superfamily
MQGSIGQCAARRRLTRVRALAVGVSLALRVCWQSNPFAVGMRATTAIPSRFVRRLFVAVALAAGVSVGTVPVAAAPVAACVPPPASLLSWWPANGSTADVVGGRAGSLRNGANFAAGMVAQAFIFNGVDQYLEVADDPAWTLGTRAFTIDLWVKFTEVRPRDPFIGHDEGGGELNKWIFWYDESGHTTPSGPALRFHINSPTLGPVDTISVPWEAAVNTWYHVAVTRNGSTYALYLNGAQIGTSTDTRVIPNPAAPLTIGKAEDFLHNGQIDEVEIFERALSPTEIAVLFNAGGAGKCGTTVASLCALSRQFVSNRAMATGMCTVLDAANLNERLGVPKGKAAELDAYRRLVNASLRARFITAEHAAILTRLSSQL